MWDTSVYWVPSGLNGEDPFAYSHIAGGVGAFAGYYAGMTTTPAVKTETKTITTTVTVGAPPTRPVGDSQDVKLSVRPQNSQLA
jgi:hypothetical protein